MQRAKRNKIFTGKKYIYTDDGSLQNLCKSISGETLYITENKVRKKVKLDENTHCHLDPQLLNYFNENNFIGSLGQVMQAESHLENQSVGVGDLFLFYGWYKIDNKDKQVLFGYLQIGEIIKTYGLTDEERKTYENKYPCLKYQPHWNTELYKNDKSNTIYLARETLKDTNLSGYGTFKYSPELVLTKDNQDLKTLWQIPSLAGCMPSWNNGRKFDSNGEIRVSDLGQEFVIEECKQAENWAISLIKKYAKR